MWYNFLKKVYEMNVKELVPKNKLDDSNIEKLYILSDEEIKPIIYDLLEWLQDYNWPVADKVLKVLLKREDLVFPHIKNILKCDDFMWKYWIMDLLIPSFNMEHKKELKQDLLDLINDSQTDEDTNDLREVAIECYNECFKNER